MIISKFGGSATASRVALENVKVLSQDKNRRILVFSAVGKESETDTKTTDLLINYSLKNANRELIEKEIMHKFERLKQNLHVGFDVYAEWREVFNRYIFTNDRNFLISRGEFITSKILAKALRIKLVPADKIFYFKDQKIDFEKTRTATLAYLKIYRQILVPGFYGADEKGDIVLLSRGGSDVSAAVFAKVLGADVYENWTDVNGIYLRDPHVQKSKQIEKMNYSKLLHLSENGAKVIHKDCAKLLIWKQVSLKVCSIFNPQSPPTIISDNLNPEKERGL